MRRAFLRMMPRIALALALAAGAGPGLAAAGTHIVVIEGMAFHPAALELQAGDTVVWVNRDIVPHTATAASPKFDSGEIAAGKSWSRRFDSPGTVSYYCAFHPVMKAKVAVHKQGVGRSHD